MGLDGVELILAAEESFGIEISDEEAGRVETAGDLCELVRGKVRKRQERVCLTSAAFYRVRRGLTAVLGVERRSIRPGSVLEELLPRSERRQLWRELAERARLRLPDLQMNGWFVLGALLLGPLGAGGAALAFGRNAEWALLAGMSGFAGSLVSLRLMVPYAVGLPREVVTVGDLARVVLATNYEVVAREAGGLHPAETWDAVRMLIHVQTGASPARITPEARLVDDLGID